MTSKSDFLTAFGGATTLVGAAKTFTAAAGNQITLTSHGLTDFTGPVTFAPQGAGVLPAGLVAATDYWLMASDSNTVQVANIDGSFVDITDAGNGTIDIARADLSAAFDETGVTIAQDTLTLTAHGVSTGYGPVRFALTGDASSLPAGLAAATDYWLIVVDANTVKVASSLANAVAGTAIDITDVGTDATGGFTCTASAVSDSFADTDVTYADGVMTSAGHGKDTGFGPVRLTTTGALPGGLAAATDYWMIVIDANTFHLAASHADAMVGIAIEIQTDGSGTNKMQATAQSLADQMEQSLDEVLTFPGNRSAAKEVNVSKFWTEAVQGMGF